MFSGSRVVYSRAVQRESGFRAKISRSPSQLSQRLALFEEMGVLVLNCGFRTANILARNRVV